MALPVRYAANMRRWFTATAATSLCAKIAVSSTSGVTGAEAAIRMFSAVPAMMTRKRTYGRVCTEEDAPITIGCSTDSYRY